MLQRKLVHQGFILLRKLAKNAGIPPDSYLVSGGADFQVEETIFACGGFTDIRRGILAEKVVAVKTIRMPPGSDFSEICKVGTIISVRFRLYETRNTGLLQGVCTLDARFPP